MQKDSIEAIIYELKHYNPQADEHAGAHIHKGWAKRLETLTGITVPERNFCGVLRETFFHGKSIGQRACGTFIQPPSFMCSHCARCFTHWGRSQVKHITTI